MLHTSDCDFELPTELIASHPLSRRDASRMLVVEPNQVPLLWRGARRAGWGKKDICLDLPVNMRLKAKAAELRKSGSLPEALLWKEISGKKINGFDFDRQHVIGNYIVDFFCSQLGFVIEIDDKSHDMKENYDTKRDNYLKGLGLYVMHIPVSDVLKNPQVVAQWIKNTTLEIPTPALRATPPAEGNSCLSDDFGNPHPGTACHPKNGGESGGVTISDKHIRDFVDYIGPGDVVVFNNSRVIPARFNATDGDGNVHEITLHTATDDAKTWWGLCKKFNKIAIGDMLTMDDGTKIEIVAHDDESGLKITFHCDDVFAVLNAVGKMPLPPYMKRDEELSDRERYQTVYADPIGSMAAPTAGLHFTNELMREIELRGAKIVKITLHVGAGTWMPVKTEDLSQHKMHSEWCCITPEQADTINNAKRVIAVGTTSMRTLETAAMHNRNMPADKQNKRIVPICCTTDIFITPGYEFGAVDVLLTNFHLPKSTLFMLVSAFAGLDEMKAAYAHAVAEKYRFFSYGDCCLLFKKDA